MKYIDADKLIAEIERWRDKANENYNKSTYSMGRCDALAEFRNHIVSLQQEQPEGDLDDEFKKWWESVSGKINIEHSMFWYMEQCARHFAEWGAIRLNARQKEQKPAEWSEEDEKMIERLIRHTQKEFDELCKDSYGHQEIISDLKESCRERMNWLENRLKSLCPQHHWKPSEVQMAALKYASTYVPDDEETLASLYDDLKKLM